jgi:hypothetical protein
MKELYHIFVRSSLNSTEYYLKNDDKSFSMFDDINETEIEITDCKHIIDFTRTPYAIQDSSYYSNYIHIMYEKSDGSR